MIKYLISLMTVLASFVGLLLGASPANANPVEVSISAKVPTNSITKTVNLNLSSPFLQLNNKTATSIFEHLGCSCTMCAQGTINLNSKN